MMVTIHEVKWLAVARHKPSEARTYFLWTQRNYPRLTPIEPATLIGNDWRLACDNREHAEWTVHWLQRACGFMPTMLKINR